MKKTITFLIFLAIIMIAPFFIESIIAQPPPLPDPEPIPIDGGLSFLLAAGMAYGAKKLHKGKKNKAE